MSLCPCACWFYSRLETAKDDATLSFSLLTNHKDYVISRNRNAETISAAHIAVARSNEFILHHIKSTNFHTITSHLHNGSLAPPFNSFRRDELSYLLKTYHGFIPESWHYPHLPKSVRSTIQRDSTFPPSFHYVFPQYAIPYRSPKSPWDIYRK